MAPVHAIQMKNVCAQASCVLVAAVQGVTNVSRDPLSARDLGDHLSARDPANAVKPTALFHVVRCPREVNATVPLCARIIRIVKIGMNLGPVYSAI